MREQQHVPFHLAGSLKGQISAKYGRTGEREQAQHSSVLGLDVAVLVVEYLLLHLIELVPFLGEHELPVDDGVWVDTQRSEAGAVEGLAAERGFHLGRCLHPSRGRQCRARHAEDRAHK